MRHVAVVAGLAVGLMSGTARAAYIITFSQTSNGVLATGSGSLDLEGLLFSNNDSESAYSDPARPSTVVGATGSFSIYEAVFGPVAPFGTGGLVYANSGTGGIIDISPDINTHAIGVPVGYVSGSDLGISTAFYKGYTFASLGLMPGTSFTYNYATTTGSDSYVVNIELSSVPLPASAPMFGAALMALGAVGYGLKRRKAATAA